MNERIVAAMANTGDLGEQVKDHVIQALALVEEIKRAQALAETNADEALAANRREEYVLAMAKVTEYGHLLWAIQTAGQ